MGDPRLVDPRARSNIISPDLLIWDMNCFGFAGLMVTDRGRTAYLLEKMERMELIGKHVVLSDGREGPIVHVEYEAPERVALVKTYPETPSPLTRVGIDRLSPSHFPYIVEIQLEPPKGQKEEAQTAGSD